MKTLLIPTLLLTASNALGALSTATGGQLTDYTNWFEPFRVASDANVTGIPNPRLNFPNAIQADGPNRDWTGFFANWSATSVVAPVFGGSAPVTAEFVFLGESGGWWNDWGYQLNGTDHLLAEGMQARDGTNIHFGDNFFLTVQPGDSLEIFITGSGVTRQDGQVTVNAQNGGRFQAYDKTLNTGGSVEQSYYGILDPLTSVREGADLSPFTVFSFEDYRVTTGRSDRDYNDLIFAVRFSTPSAEVPEPATYGALAAVVLLGFIGLRRRGRCPVVGSR